MKLLTIGFLSFLALPVMATEVTSPFYLPELGHVQSKTNGQYTKNKRKTMPNRYQRQLAQEITIGLGAGIATLAAGDLNWTRQNGSFPHTKGYAAGLKGQWDIGGILTQFSTWYHQTTNVSFEARRQMEAQVRLGKQLQKMTPYISLKGKFPMNARPEFNDPVYRGDIGVFQPINDKMTLDTTLYLKYDKNIKERSFGIRGEYSYAVTSWLAFGVQGEWQARGHAKSNTKTYHQSVGVKTTLSF